MSSTGQEVERYIISREEIEAYPGIDKTHFLNDNARRCNKSLGDLAGLSGIGFHIIEIQPGHESTELHRHHHEEECAIFFFLFFCECIHANGTLKIALCIAK